MLSRPFITRIPAQEMIPTKQEDKEDFVIATRDSEGTYAMIYFPTGKSSSVDSSTLSSKMLKVSWYDPRTGNQTSAGFISRAPNHTFVPPSSGEKGHDWV